MIRAIVLGLVLTFCVFIFVARAITPYGVGDIHRACIGHGGVQQYTDSFFAMAIEANAIVVCKDGAVVGGVH